MDSKSADKVAEDTVQQVITAVVEFWQSASPSLFIGVWGSIIGRHIWDKFVLSGYAMEYMYAFLDTPAKEQLAAAISKRIEKSLR